MNHEHRPCADSARAPCRAFLASALGAALTLVAVSAPAQTAPPRDEVRDAIAGARLGTGYAQMINLSATPYLSAASYTVDALDPTAKINLFHLPYRAQWLALSPDAQIDWRVAAGWLQFKQDFPVNAGGGFTGSVDSKWSAYSAAGGLIYKARLGNGFTLEPALDVGIARLVNDASYNGAGELLKPIYDGLLFNWNANAWIVTPSLALEWKTPLYLGTFSVSGQVARSWIGSFDETDPVQHFNEAANIYSARAEYVQPTEWKVFDRPVNAVGFAGYTGFFGANRDVFGFTGVAEFGGGVEAPVDAAKPKAERLRLAGSYLVGSGVWGWTVGVSLEY